MEEKRDNIQPEEKIEAVEETDSREYNASFEEEDPVSSMSEDELQDELLRDSGMNGFQRYVAKLDDKIFNIYQRILGVLLAIGCSVALFWRGSNDTEGAFSWSLIIAVLIALMVPNIIEKQSLRKIPKARNTLAITLLIIIVIYFLIIGFRSGFKFTSA